MDILLSYQDQREYQRVIFLKGHSHQIWEKILGLKIGDPVCFYTYDIEYYGWIIDTRPARINGNEIVVIGVTKIKTRLDKNPKKFRSQFFVPLRDLRFWKQAPKMPKFVQNIIDLKGEEVC